MSKAQQQSCRYFLEIFIVILMNGMTIVMAFRIDERESNTPQRWTTWLASVEKRSARIMSFRRIIMRERSRRARQSVSFTCRGRFNYPIASSLPHHHSAPLSTPRFLFRAIESHRNSVARVRAGGIQIARYRLDNPRENDSRGRITTNKNWH